MDQIVELRHDRERRDVALAQSAHEFGGVERFQIDDARSLHQREQQIGHLRQHVKERQHAEQRVGGAEIDPVEHGLDLAQEIGVGQHHALGIGGGAGSVEQGSEIVVLGWGRFEFARAGVEDCGQIAQPVILDGMVGHAVGIHEDEAQVQLGDRRPCYRNMFGVAEDGRGAAVFQKFRDLVGVQGGVERNGGAARGNDSQVGRDPARMVIGQNRES